MAARVGKTEVVNRYDYYGTVRPRPGVAADTGGESLIVDQMLNLSETPEEIWLREAGKKVKKVVGVVRHPVEAVRQIGRRAAQSKVDRSGGV